MKYLGYSLMAVVALIVLGVAMAWVSARMSLDEGYAHTQATAELPLLGADLSEGLVRIPTDRGEFRARIAGFQGEQERPLIILLHGFPVTSAMWLELIPPLAEAGYRVVAFDQRGYSPQVRPDGTANYAVPELVSDVFAVADAVGGGPFHLVGHDWGAAVGWGAVLTEPDRAISWTPLSIAHPAAFQAALANDPDQQSRSSYFALFQTAMVPETLFSFNDFAFLKGAYGGMSPEKIDEYIAVFSEPGALSAALNWYRAMGLTGLVSAGQQSMEVRVPTLFIWGNQDEAVGRRGTELMADYMKGPYSIIELDAGHWLLSERPEQVIQPVLAHIAGNDSVADEDASPAALIQSPMDEM